MKEERNACSDHTQGVFDRAGVDPSHIREGIELSSLEPEGEAVELGSTTLCGHGTAVLRYRADSWAAGGVSWWPCPVSGRSSPRVLSAVRPLADATP